MLKYFTALVCILSFWKTNAQFVSEPEEVVIAFFNAFHEQDTLALRALVHKRVTMQSLSDATDSGVKLSTSSFDAFLKSIASIPSTVIFEERILDYKTRQDALMANVWTPYAFYIDGQLSHCGTNSFQMLYEDDQWKIFYIVDTRMSGPCN